MLLLFIAGAFYRIFRLHLEGERFLFM